MRVGAREGFAYRSVKLVLLANCNRHDVDFNTFFQAVRSSSHLKNRTVLNMPIFDTHLYLQSVRGEHGK
jgi:hypothetical protein